MSITAGDGAEAGHICQNWLSNTPHQNTKYHLMGDHNYCRNPDDSDTVWCYTTSPAVRWAYCSLPARSSSCVRAMPPPPSPSQPPVAPHGVAGGLLYRSYSGWTRNDVDGLHDAEPTEVGTEPFIDKHQGFEFGEHNYAASWTGTLYIEVSAVYTFYVYANDGARLLIDGQRILNFDGVAIFGARERSARVELESGPHSIYVAFYNVVGDMRIRLSWQAISAGINKQVIPATAFLSPRLNSLRASYYGLEHGNFRWLPDLSAREPEFSRRESRIHYELTHRWGGPNLTEANGWAVRWEGEVYLPIEAAYTWHVQSHGGARLSLDGSTAVDDTEAHTNRERSGTVTLTAGVHRLQLDYYQALGDHGCVLRYESSQIALAKQHVPMSALVGGEAVPDLYSPSTAVSVETWLDCGATPAHCTSVNATFVRSSSCNSDGDCCANPNEHFVLCARRFEEAEDSLLVAPPSAEGCVEVNAALLLTFASAASNDAAMSPELCNLLCFGDAFFLLHDGGACYCIPGLDAGNNLTVIDSSTSTSACSRPCIGAPASSCGGDDSAASLYERNRQHDARQQVVCKEYSPAMSCAQQASVGAAACGTGLLASPADCSIGKDAVCRRCTISSPPAALAPNSTVASMSTAMVTSAGLFQGFAQPASCGGQRHHACFDESTGEPSTGCLVPWDGCPSLMAEATAVECGSDGNTCQASCILVRWRYECSAALLSSWTTTQARDVEIDHAAWSFAVEVERFDSGVFLGIARDAAIDSIRGVQSVLGQLQRRASAAAAALERLAAHLAVERQSMCGGDLDAECGSACAAHLFEVCVIPSYPALLCRAICRGQMLLMLAAEWALQAGKLVLDAAQLALEALQLATNAAAWVVSKLDVPWFRQQLLVIHKLSMRLDLRLDAFNSTSQVTFNGTVLGTRFFIDAYPLSFSTDGLIASLPGFVTSVVFPAVECAHEKATNATGTSCTAAHRRRRLAPEWRMQEARRALDEASRMLSLSQQAHREASSSLPQASTVAKLEQAIMDSLDENREIARLLARVPRPYKGLNLEAHEAHKQKQE